MSARRLLRSTVPCPCKNRRDAPRRLPLLRAGSGAGRPVRLFMARQTSVRLRWRRSGIVSHQIEAAPPLHLGARHLRELPQHLRRQNEGRA